MKVATMVCVVSHWINNRFSKTRTFHSRGQLFLRPKDEKARCISQGLFCRRLPSHKVSLLRIWHPLIKGNCLFHGSHEKSNIAVNEINGAVIQVVRSSLKCCAFLGRSESERDSNLVGSKRCPSTRTVTCPKREKSRERLFVLRLEMSKNPINPKTELVHSVLLANHRHFLRFIKVQSGNYYDAEDILQDALVKALAKSGEIRDAENAIAWFYRILRNAVTDHYRDVAATKRVLSKLTLQTTEKNSSSENVRIICDCSHKLIPLMKKAYSEIISRVDLDGQTVGSFANELGLSLGNARTRLHRARKTLRDELMQYCGTCADNSCLGCTCTRHEAPVPG